MVYGDGKYQSFAKPRIGKDGRSLDRIASVEVPHSQWREEVAKRGPGATYAAYFDPAAQARAASHKLGLPTDEMLAWQNDPKNIEKFDGLAVIQYRVPISP